MKKFRIFIIICLLLCVTTSIIPPFTCNAKSSNSSPIGVYVIHVPVNKTVKVYIEPSLKDFVESNGITVYKEEKKILFFPTTIKYYYFADKYIDRIVGTRELKNDIDSMIFMVDELEKEAKKDDPLNYKNLVLGYIRTINRSYDGLDPLSSWSTFAGENPTGFINKMNADYSHGIRFVDYFSQFVSYSGYNKAVHGALPEKYQRSSPLFLYDSLDTPNSIDLTHLFACIDGIYADTGSSIIANLGNNKMQHDIVSWNGDLQQAAYALSVDERSGKLPAWFYSTDKTLLFKQNYGASEADMLADIDAMNITMTYINQKESGIADSLRAYYLLIEKAKSVRYKMFIKCVLLETEESNSASTEIERFENEIYNQFNIKKSSQGKLINHNYHSPKQFLGFGIMRSNSWLPLNLYGDLPSESVRAFVTDAFVQYIKKNTN